MTGAVALVTGAGGFVGSAVARALLAEGAEVRALVRAGSSRANLDGLGLTIVEGDMRDPAAMARACAGADFVFHVAADYRLWARDSQEIIRANVDGTSAVMTAARDAGVARIVYTSSVATLKPRTDGRPVDETAVLTPEGAIGAYKRSKVLAERLVEAMAADGLPVTMVNPSTPIGPRDAKPTPTGRIIVDAACGRIPAFVDTGLNLVHVDDVAAGHLAAARHGAIGERHILGGSDVSLEVLLAAIATRIGRKPPTLRLPRAPLWPLALVAEGVAQITGKEPMLTRDGLAMAKNVMFFTSAKAQARLAYHARPWTDALDDALHWFGANGYLRR
ncbi:NAD-dependent dehydratase [alpha proteobacterium AAP81b]|nr:NAD-dependent dehydratase [alpha proteobacterium AAP81b]